MIRYCLALYGLLMLLIPCSFAGEWYPGYAHFQTDQSDGGKSPADAAKVVQAELLKYRNDGKGFWIVTDHYPGVFAKGSAVLSNYPSLIRSTGIPGQFVALPGFEHETKWRPESNTVATSHILAIGFLPDNFRQFDNCYDQTGGTLTDKFDYQQQLIDQIVSLGMLSVAAHPSQLVFGGTSTLRTDYRFNTKSGFDRLCIVEMYNVLGFGQEEEAIAFYLRLVASGQAVFVTSGCDYHGTTASTIPELALDALSRITWVYADGLTPDGIVRGIASGQTYAAQYGASFLDFSRCYGRNPSSKISGCDIPVIQAKALVKASDVELQVYRNGQEVLRQAKKSDPSRLAFYSLTRSDSAGINSPKYNDEYLGWVDTDRTPKTRSYVIRVNGKINGVKRTLLITSPLWLQPRPAGQTAEFFDAIKAGNTARVVRMLSTDQSLANERDWRSMTDNETAKFHSSRPLALSVAIACGRNDIAELLLRTDAKPDDFLASGEPGPLMVAAYCGDIEASELLIEHGGDVNISTDGNTPLVWAIDRHHSDLAIWLINHGADVNHSGDSGRKPLALARIANLPEVIRLLQSRGAKE